MGTGSQTATESKTINKETTEAVYTIVLHNDDTNSFDYVTMALVEICDHDIIQAEQCTYITHFKGQCDIKVGTKEILTPIKEKLISKGLCATIEKT